MSSRRDKNDAPLAIGDVVDVRGVIEMLDDGTGMVYVRIGVTPLAVGTGTSNKFQDTGNVLKVKLGDVLKVA